MYKLVAIVLSVLTLGTHAAPMSVPHVYGVDQSPTRPQNYGKCTAAIERDQRESSHWCKFGRLGSWPEYPNAAAKNAFKFARQTTYSGPILSQRFACNVLANGSDSHAMIAVSTKYLKSTQGGWVVDKGACGKCMCISILGGDSAYNKGLQHGPVLKRKGLSFMGRVADRCGENMDDGLDVLLDRPYAYAPLVKNNPLAYKANRIAGVRAFKELEGPYAPQSVGTWTALWQFVPCAWTHAKCAEFVKSYGYKTYTPGHTHARQ